MSWISAVLALIKAIPWFQQKFDELMLFYVQTKIKEHDLKFRDALSELINSGSQIKLEEAIGSDNAGKPTLRREGIRSRASKNTTDSSSKP